ncbi:MAG: multicopper oxidase domain-containing protein [Prochlorococcaceae cyanobacterium]|jgi:FtsP/CotA-like multicopper oxidase with cupredoxin domain
MQLEQPTALGQSERPWSRRRLLSTGCLSAAGLGLLALRPGARAMEMGGGHGKKIRTELPFDPQLVLRSFERGQLINEAGRVIRVFEVEARSINLPLAEGITFKAWSLDGRVPGPTLRAREGERIRVVFRNSDNTSHSLHFHGVHAAAVDGVTPVLRGQSQIYEFDLPRAGLYPYHCHVAPVARHVGKGLFGLLIVEPQTPRPPADELVLVMGGYDLDNDGHNELYAFNGIPDAYLHQPIQIHQNALVRVYLLNMVELDPPLSFHIHGNEFSVLRRGTPEITDVFTLGIGERQILEFRYPFSGRYMFHPHQDVIAERGCMGLFEVMPS